MARPGQPSRATCWGCATACPVRGTGVTVFTTIAALLGSSVGTVIIPFLSDRVFHSESAIGLGIACLIGVSCPIAAVVLAGGFGAMRRAMAEAEREL